MHAETIGMFVLLHVMSTCFLLVSLIMRSRGYDGYIGDGAWYAWMASNGIPRFTVLLTLVIDAVGALLLACNLIGTAILH